MHRYTFDRQYYELFKRMGLDVRELLTRSGLPEDLFSRREILLTRIEYFKLIETIGQIIQDDNTILRIATEGSVETLMPPIFAAYCSQNGLSFLERFATYKRLMGPVKITLYIHEKEIEIALTSDNDEIQLPHFFTELELLFIVGILRKSTQTEVIPLKIETCHKVTNPAVHTYLGCIVRQGEHNRLTFAMTDMLLPFTSRNDIMWEYFEPELRRRLSEMEIDDSMAVRVRSSLIELLPAGRSTINDVASKLCLSRRTLQRKLAEEHTTFQQQLHSTRLLLAQNYLKNEDRTTEDIAFLLGYEDITSFMRAFNAWTGMTISEYKKQRK